MPNQGNCWVIINSVGHVPHQRILRGIAREKAEMVFPDHRVLGCSLLAESRAFIVEQVEPASNRTPRFSAGVEIIGGRAGSSRQPGGW